MKPLALAEKALFCGGGQMRQLACPEKAPFCGANDRGSI